MKKLGKFEILERVGQGAMGVVYKARDPLIGRLVALKTITTGLAEDPALLERFYHEAHSAGALQHPNIVTIYELGEEDHTPFIAMEYLTGQSLDKMIENHQALPLSQRIGYIAYVCRALAYAHKQGVVHRDIKPANVMVTSDGTVKVVDFGIARIAENSKSQTGLVIGTLGYMSPQQIEGGRADARSDVWAAGVLFYELLAYRRPFDGDNYGALMLNIMTHDVPPLSETAPGTPPDVEEVLEGMLKKDVNERFQSMEEVLIALEPVWRRLQHEEVSDLLESSRETLKAGDAPKAFEMVRRVLQIDTANAPAKTLLEQINAEMRRTRTGAAPTVEKKPADDETLVGNEVKAIRAPTTPIPSSASRTQKTPVPSQPAGDTASRLRAVTESRRIATASPPPEVAATPVPTQVVAPARKQPVAVVLIVLVAVIALGGGAYLYKVRSQPTSASVSPNVTAPPTAEVSPASATVPHVDSTNPPPAAAAVPASAVATDTGRQQPPVVSNPSKKPADVASPARSNPPAQAPQTQASQGGNAQPPAANPQPAAQAPASTLVAANNPAPAPVPAQPVAAAPQPVAPPPSQPQPAPVAQPAAKPADPVPAKAAEPTVVSSVPEDNLDRQAIVLSLNQLSAAFQHRSVSELEGLWPKLPKDDKNTYKKAFDSVKSITRDFHLQSLNFSNDGSTATAVGTYDGTFQDSKGVQTPNSGNFYVRFAKKNGRWYIDEARF